MNPFGVSANAPDPSLESQRDPDYEARLLETRQRMDAERRREEDATRAKAEDDREFWRRARQERQAAIAEAEATAERIRRLIGTRDLKEVVCDLLDRVAALEAASGAK